MPADTCVQPDCTFSVTGTCLLGNDPASCPGNKFEQQHQVTLPGSSVSDQIHPLTPPVDLPRFPSSTPMGRDRVAELMAQRYCRLIGILGAPNSGKTALLSSLYHLVSNGALSGYEYARSHTLMGFEEISRGSRQWNEGHIPDQVTAHTQLSDERAPGFLHLRLRTASDGKCTDLLLPDLPGEWTVSLVDQSRSDRWDFLRRADTIWFVLDGRSFTQGKHMHAIHRFGLAIDALHAFLGEQLPPVLLVITRRDLAEPSQLVLDKLELIASDKGVNLQVHSVASFSGADEDVPPGFGIDSLVRTTLAFSFRTEAKGGRAEPPNERRSMLRYRARGAGKS